MPILAAAYRFLLIVEDVWKSSVSNSGLLSSLDIVIYRRFEILKLVGWNCGFDHEQDLIGDHWVWNIAL